MGAPPLAGVDHVQRQRRSVMPEQSTTSWGSERGPMKTSSTVVNFGDQHPQVRQCGRCRGSFPADTGLHPVALPEWWLCPPCREALLGQSGFHLVSADGGVRPTPR